jgi:Ferritin-like
MRTRFNRHLGEFFKGTHHAPGVTKLHSLSLGAAAECPSTANSNDEKDFPLEFSPHQYLIFLLHIAAEIEHALMVEYLYAGYTLGGPQVPEEHREEVARWQEIIAGIAKEEMGHLMTVQNLLRVLGGPLNLDREDYPWDSGMVPFPFRLEPLTLPSLARFVVAESPADWDGPEAEEIKEMAKQGMPAEAQLHRVGKLYDLLMEIIADEECIPDSFFRASTLPYQASWDEWGRGYKGGARGNSHGCTVAGTPDVILLQISSRTEALAALKAISTQGEANLSDKADAPSHFARFLGIYRQFPTKQNWASRLAPINPIVPNGFTPETDDVTPIEAPEAQLWGSLFNVRYQLLLTSLLHTFDYPSNLDPHSQATPRGLLIHTTFGEMYNLRAISLMLVQTPLKTGDKDKVAGPPFQMPYTLELPVDAVDRWRVHLDLFEGTKRVVSKLLPLAAPARHTYLQALLEGDARNAAAIQTMLNCEGHSTLLHSQR